MAAALSAARMRDVHQEQFILTSSKDETMDRRKFMQNGLGISLGFPLAAQLAARRG